MTILPACGHALCRDCWMGLLSSVAEQDTDESTPEGFFRCPGYEHSARCPSFVSYELIYSLLGVSPPPHIATLLSAQHRREEAKKAVVPTAVVVDPELKARWAAIDAKQALVRSLARHKQAPVPLGDIQFVDEQGRDLLIWATSYNSLLVLQYLLEHYKEQLDVNVQDARGRTPLIYAAIGGHTRVAQQLLALGADPTLADDRGTTALQYATVLPMTENSEQLVKLLVDELEKRAHSPPSSILLEAAPRNRSKAISSLLTAFPGALDLNVTDAQGRTPLHHAANAGATDAVRVLLNSKALVDPVDHKGATPLILAAREGPGIVFSLLLSSGASTHHSDHYHYTPLTWLAQSGHTHLLSTLRERDALVGVDDIVRAIIKARGQGVTETAVQLRSLLAVFTGPPSLSTIVSETILRRDTSGAPLSHPLLITLGPSHSRAQTQ